MTFPKVVALPILAACLTVFAACEDDRAGAEERAPEMAAPAAETTQAQQQANTPQAPQAAEPQGATDTNQPGATNQPDTNQPGATNQPAAAGALASVRDSIVQARCEREEKCNNVGSGKKYASRSACETEVRSEWREDLNAYECPKGVDQKELDECKAEIRGEKCDSMLDTLSRLTACRSATICQD